MEKILERVRKLLALAGNNPNENEALAALEKAHGILAEHNLLIEEVRAAGDGKGSEDMERGAGKTDTNLPERHFRHVWSAVARAHFCVCASYRPNPKRYRTIYTMVGRRINVIVATQMALYLCQTMRRLASEEMARAGRRDHAYKNAYLVGLASRIVQRLMELTERAPGKGLVLYTGNEQELNAKFFEENLGGLKQKKQVSVAYNGEGFARGYVDGDRVSFSQQVAADDAKEATAIGA